MGRRDRGQTAAAEGTISTTPTILLEDRFTVASCDDSKFEQVTRVRGRSAAFDADITLDFNTHIYPIRKKEVGQLILYSESISEAVQVLNFAFAIPGTLAMTPELQSLLDDYEYVCHGTIFNEDEKQDRR